jgi:DNA replication protein DnaC
LLMKTSGAAVLSREVASVLDNPTISRLKEMKLTTMAHMMSEPDHTLLELSFEERFSLMVEREWISRKNNRIKRLLNSANLSQNACLEDIRYSDDRNIDKKIIQTLSTGSYIHQFLNVIVCGKTGAGKSFLACALGNNACRQGHTVRSFRMPELLLEIQDAKAERRYSKYMSQLLKIKLLILDDIGLKSYTLEESRDILEIIENRYNKASIIMVGQISYTRWYELFPDPTLADAIMDRIIHNAYIISLDSKKSMREVMAGEL